MVDLLAIAGPMDAERRRALLRRMGQAAQPGRTIRYLHVDEEIGVAVVADEQAVLGRVIAWGEEACCFALLQGELLDGSGDAAELLRLERRYGASYTQRLNGHFAALLWDGEERRMSLLTDHLGLYPLYYHVEREVIFAATRMDYLLALPDIRPTLDRRALAAFLALEYPLGESTFVEQIALVPPATCLSWKGGLMRLETYWRPWALSPSPLQARDRWLEGLLHYLREAVARQRLREGEDGVLLSGGLDSRLLLALMVAEGRRPRTYTFGLRGSDDARWAAEVARTLHLPHHLAVLHPSRWPQIVEEAVRLTEGMTGAVHFHLLWGERESGLWPSALVLGFLGDALFGSHLSSLLWGRYGEGEVRRYLFRQANVAFRREDLERLLTPRWYGALRDAAWEAFRDVVSPPVEDAAQLAVTFDLWQRQRRFIAQGHRLLRPRHRVILPFADRELVTYVLRIPPGLLLNRALMIDALLRLSPKLGHVPYTGTRLPLISSLRSVAMRAERQLRWRLRALGLRAVPPPRLRPYADYDRWLAVGGPLHRWVRTLLLAPETRLHAIFAPRALEQWLDAAHGERRVTRQIGVLVSLELWMRAQSWL